MGKPIVLSLIKWKYRLRCHACCGTAVVLFSKQGEGFCQGALCSLVRGSNMGSLDTAAPHYAGPPWPATEDHGLVGGDQAMSNSTLSGAWSPRHGRMISPGHLGLTLASQGLADGPSQGLSNAVLRPEHSTVVE